MTEQLEHELTARMRRQADRMPGDIDLAFRALRRGRRLRRRRKVASAAVVTALLTIAIPVGTQALDLPREVTGSTIATESGTFGSSEQNRPQTQTGPVQLDLHKLPHGTTTLPWWDSEAETINEATHITPGRSTVSWLTEVEPGKAYAIASARDDQGRAHLYLEKGDNVTGLEANTLGQIAVSADGSRLAWTTSATNSTDTIVTVASTKSGNVIAKKRFSTVALRAGVRFAKDRVVLTNDLRALPSNVWLWEPSTDRVTQIPGINVTSTSPETGLISIVTDVKDTKSGSGRLCSVVVDTAAADRKIWQSCDLTPVAFSPDGQYALAKPSLTDETGIRSYTMIHLPTGNKVGEFRADQLGGARWEADSRGFVVEVEADRSYALVQCGIDTRCRLVTDPVPYQKPFPANARPRPYLLSSR